MKIVFSYRSNAVFRSDLSENDFFIDIIFFLKNYILYENCVFISFECSLSLVKYAFPKKE